MSDPVLFPGDDGDPWGWWRKAVDHAGEIGIAPLVVHAEEPQCGYYRVRRKGGQWEPVAIFRDPDTGILQAERSGRPVIGDRINDLWLWACREPIAYEDWEQATTGGGFADEPSAAIPGIGDNIREADAFDGLNIEWLGEREQAEEILKTPIADKAAADRAAIWADRLIKIAKRAESLHSVEKAPVLIAGRRVDDRWRDLREQPALLAKGLKGHQKKWLDEQDRLERERVATATREAERLRREAAAKIAVAEAERRRVAEEVARSAAEARRLSREGHYQESQEAQRESLAKAAHGNELMAQAGAAVAAVKQAERETAFRNPSAGRTGARVKLVTYKSAEIVDIDVLFQAIKSQVAIVTVLQQIADRAARADIALPGCRIVEERRPA